jgi:hypothetical protein
MAESAMDWHQFLINHHEIDLYHALRAERDEASDEEANSLSASSPCFGTKS